MSEKQYKLSKTNLILICVSLAVIIIGFILMVGKPSGSTYNADIYSTRRITIGPMISFFGFLSMIFSILYKPKHNPKNDNNSNEIEKAEK